MWALLFRLRSLVRDERGQDLVEYALLAGFLAVAAAATLPGIAESIAEIFDEVEHRLEHAAEA